MGALCADLWDFDVAVPPAAQLGEGPRWDAATGTLLWVDILGRAVHRFDPSIEADVAVDVHDLVSFALPRADGGVIVGLPDGVFALEDGRTTPLVPLEGGVPCTRTNDAACDAQGRLWVGTMAMDERSPIGGLYRVEAGGVATKLVDAATIANGLGWSPDGSRFYFIDSPTRRVDVFDHDPGTGDVRDRRPLVTVETVDAVPDGMAVDADGCLWVALHGGWGLNRYAPDGELLAEVRLPVAKVTSCCFGGPSLTDLYVTTRRESLSDAELAEQPLAGALLRLDPGVAGQPTYAFAG